MIYLVYRFNIMSYRPVYIIIMCNAHSFLYCLHYYNYIHVFLFLLSLLLLVYGSVGIVQLL